MTELKEILCAKDARESYGLFLQLEEQAKETGELYANFPLFLGMLSSASTYIRVRGFRMICAVARWDDRGLVERNLPVILSELEDEKPTAVRQCLAVLPELLKCKPGLIGAVRRKLSDLDLTGYRSSMQPLLRRDIAALLEKFAWDAGGELLDVVDEQGIPTGAVVPREKAHAQGIRHRTAHVWLVRFRAGKPQILLQKRCKSKDSWPGCYDISSAGHIPAGVDFIPSALRELREELGVEAAPGELVFCGNRQISADGVFHGYPFHDRQYSRVFVLLRDWEEGAFTVQAEEIDSVRWMDLEECMEAVEKNTIPNCIYPEELALVKAAVQKKA